jgi:hypothetical protein
MAGDSEEEAGEIIMTALKHCSQAYTLPLSRDSIQAIPERKRTPMHIVLTLLLSYIITTDMNLNATPALAGPAPEIAIVQDWLTQIDTHHDAASWTSASQHFRTMITQTQWEQALATYRAPLGTLISRTNPVIQRTTTMPGLPDGNYAGIIFHSSFSKKANTIETVVLIKDTDRQWRVLGYTIK